MVKSQLAEKMVIIAVVGMSNALGGVLGANILCPVINCPMFADKVDMMVNIHSNYSNAV